MCVQYCHSIFPGLRDDFCMEKCVYIVGLGPGTYRKDTAKNEPLWAMVSDGHSVSLSLAHTHTHTHIRIDVQTYRETHTLQFGSTLVTYLHTFKTFSIVVFVNFLFVLFLQVVSRLIVYSWNSRSNISDSRISLTFGRMNLCSRERFI